MPPLAVDRRKAVVRHELLKPHAVFMLLGRDFAAVRMGTLAEIVEGASHIEFLAGGHIEQREIDRAAAAVAGFARDVAQTEQILLFEIGIEKRLHPLVEILNAPEDKVTHGPRGAIGVEHLEAIAHDVGLIADRLKGAGGVLREQGDRFLIAVDAVADEVIGGVIANLLHNAGDIVAEEDEARRVELRLLLIVDGHGFHLGASKLKEQRLAEDLAGLLARDAVLRAEGAVRVAADGTRALQLRNGVFCPGADGGGVREGHGRVRGAERGALLQREIVYDDGELLARGRRYTARSKRHPPHRQRHSADTARQARPPCGRGA